MIKLVDPAGLSEQPANINEVIKGLQLGLGYIQQTAGNALAILFDVILDIDTPEDYNRLYADDFNKLGEYVKENPLTGLNVPDLTAILPDIPLKSKKAYMALQLIHSLLPPPPGKIIKAN